MDPAARIGIAMGVGGGLGGWGVGGAGERFHLLKLLFLVLFGPPWF